MDNSAYKKLDIINYDTNRVWVLCPFHNDVGRPNMSISLESDYYGKYKCWACGKTGRLTNKQMDGLKLDRNIVKVIKSIKKNKVESFDSKVQFYKNILNTMPLFKYKLLHELDVDVTYFDDYDIGFDGSTYTIPMKQRETICGIQHRAFDGKKFCTPGSSLGLFYSNTFIDMMWSDCSIFICEGFSDTICVDALGYFAIGRSNCFDIDSIIDFFTYLYTDVMDTSNLSIYIIPDNDDVGQQGAQTLHKRCYDDLDINSVNIVKFKGAKDIRALIQKKGKQYVGDLLDEY